VNWLRKGEEEKGFSINEIVGDYPIENQEYYDATFDSYKDALAIAKKLVSEKSDRLSDRELGPAGLYSVEIYRKGEEEEDPIAIVLKDKILTTPEEIGEYIEST